MFRALPSSFTSAQPSFCSVRNPLLERQQTSIQLARTSPSFLPPGQTTTPASKPGLPLFLTLSMYCHITQKASHPCHLFHPDSENPLFLFWPWRTEESSRKSHKWPLSDQPGLGRSWCTHSVLGQPKGSQGCSSQGDAAKLPQGTMATLAVMQIVTSIDHMAYCRTKTPLAPKNPTQPTPTARVRIAAVLA